MPHHTLSNEGEAEVDANWTLQLHLLALHMPGKRLAHLLYSFGKMQGCNIETCKDDRLTRFSTQKTRFNSLPQLVCLL